MRRPSLELVWLRKELGLAPNAPLEEVMIDGVRLMVVLQKLSGDYPKRTLSQFVLKRCREALLESMREAIHSRRR
jgi:hypothetical protein